MSAVAPSLSFSILLHSAGEWVKTQEMVQVWKEKVFNYIFCFLFFVVLIYVIQGGCCWLSEANYMELQVFQCRSCGTAALLNSAFCDIFRKVFPNSIAEEAVRLMCPFHSGINGPE